MSIKIIRGTQGEEIQNLIECLHEIEKKSWEPEMQATRDEIARRLEIFSEGLWRIERDSVITGYLYTVRMQEANLLQKRTWDEITNLGVVEDDPDGNVLFGVTLGASNPGDGELLLRGFLFQLDQAVYPSLKSLYLCSRIPRLHKLNESKDSISSNLISHVQRDPTIRMFLTHGMKIVHIVDDCYTADFESLGYGALLRYSFQSTPQVLVDQI